MPKQKQTPTSKTPEAQTPTPEAKAAVMREPSEFQKFLSDLLGDMIANGGNNWDIESVLKGVLSHHRKRLFGYELNPRNGNKKEAQIDEFIKDNLEDWRDKLSMSWPLRGQPIETAATDSQTISQRIRANWKGEMEEQFQNFLGGAMPEEFRLMSEILAHWEGSSTNRPENADDEEEITIANAFAIAVGNGEHYIKVPSKHWSLIMAYLNLLDGKECGKAA